MRAAFRVGAAVPEVCVATFRRRDASRGFVSAAGVAAAVSAFLLCAPAAADEELARRLGALKALVAPKAALAARAAPPSDGPLSCGGGSWWRVTDYGVQTRIEGAVRHASIRYGVEASLIRAVIATESAYDVGAVSHKGAQGLMQLMPATARQLGVVCPFEPRENIMGGSRYLREMYDRFGSWPLALAAYNAGPRAVERRRFPEETRRYVRLVVARWRPRLLAWIDLD